MYAKFCIKVFKNLLIQTFASFNVCIEYKFIDLNLIKKCSRKVMQKGSI